MDVNELQFCLHSLKSPSTVIFPLDGLASDALGASDFEGIFRDSVAVLPSSALKAALMKKQTLHSARLVQ